MKFNVLLGIVVFAGAVGVHSTWADEVSADEMTSNTDVSSDVVAGEQMDDAEAMGHGGGGAVHGGGGGGGVHGGGPGPVHGGGPAPVHGGGPGPVHGGGPAPVHGGGPGPVHGGGPAPVHGGGPGPVHGGGPIHGPDPVHGGGPIHGPDPVHGGGPVHVIHDPYPIHGGGRPWPIWNHPIFPRPVYGWNWNEVTLVTCTAQDAYGDQYPITEDDFSGLAWETNLPTIEDNALDYCHVDSSDGDSCFLVGCTPTY